jgi:hypothetical protein
VNSGSGELDTNVDTVAHDLSDLAPSPNAAAIRSSRSEAATATVQIRGPPGIPNARSSVRGGAGDDGVSEAFRRLLLVAFAHRRCEARAPRIDGIRFPKAKIARPALIRSRCLRNLANEDIQTFFLLKNPLTAPRFR